MPLLSQISQFVSCEFFSEDREINEITLSSLSHFHSLTWTKSKDNLEQVDNGVVICALKDYENISRQKNVTYIPVENPRLTFAKVVNHLFQKLLPDNFTNCVSDFKNRNDLKIGDNVFIGKNVQIGEGTQIHHNSVIYSNTTIGKNCVINANVSIGTEGLGLEFDVSTNLYVKFPQIGSVEISDYVEIGPSSTIRRSALGTTRIGRGSKLGALCNIGHNCIIGENTLLTCNVILAGSSVIGDDVYMGISSTLKNTVKIGNKATIGQGAVVVKNVPENETWVGNPAKRIK
jgi:UDP-3-O-[3-hydroxymyristoyl] glucosamine N-acyltransferase